MDNQNTLYGPDRIHVLDFLRGIAVLGILVLNIENFAYAKSFNPYLFGFDTELDHSVRFWVYYLFQGKFFSIFSILFGVSFYLMMDKLSQKYNGLTAMDIYARRLLVLFVIGIAHAYLVWDGDILHHYAICGLFLFTLRSFGQKQLLLISLLLCGSIMYNGYERTNRAAEQYQAYQVAISVEEDDRSSSQQRAINRWQRRTSESNPDYYQDDISIRQGSYWDNLLENIDSIKVIKGQLFHDNILFNTLLLMMIGILLYRTGIFESYQKWRYYWIITSGLLVLSMYLAYDRYHHWSFDYLNPNTHVIKGMMYSIIYIVQGISYVLVLNGLYQKLCQSRHVNWPRYLKPINNVGRMALTNYLLQSLICALIFYGYGGNLFNQLSRSELLMIIPLIGLFNIVFSCLYLYYFSQGPMEKLWRKWSYVTSAKSIF